VLFTCVVRAISECLYPNSGIVLCFISCTCEGQIFVPVLQLDLGFIFRGNGIPIFGNA